MAYALRRDEFERHALADRQGLIASGRVDDLSRLPTVAQELDRFDAWLRSEPERVVVDVEQLELKRALGVA